MPKKVRKKRVTKTVAEKQRWQKKFLSKIEGIHSRNVDKIVARILKRADTTKHGLVARSKKYNVECEVTADDLRELLFDAYGTACKYCRRKLVIQNIVVDHIVPISKRGTSNIDNLQVICRPCNTMKGSLSQENFSMLLEWLETVPLELQKDIRIRLARGIH